jgi:hypothetical protein
LKGKRILATHTRPDLDALASVWLLQKYGNKKEREAVLIFLKNGDEAIFNDLGIIFIDRGRGELDHHGRRFNSGETSASLVAKKLGVTEEKSIQKLLRKVQRSDLMGESLPFDISDFIKCAQRNKDLSDEEITRLGLRMLTAAMEFQMQKLQRDHPWIQAVIVEFLKTKEERPAAFEEYIQKLSNPRFERPFDLVEITVGEKVRSGEEEAIKFARELLELKYKDYVESFQRALVEVDKAWKKRVRGILIVADISDEPAFNRAARYRGATVIIQRNTDGYTQWFFDTEKVDDFLTDSIAAMTRLEECLVQGRKIPNIDLRRPGRIEEIPEWYYYKAPQLGKKRPGRFILNGSLTAREDIPKTKIPLDTLRYIAECAVQYWGKFNWARWATERIALYLK